LPELPSDIIYPRAYAILFLKIIKIPLPIIAPKPEPLYSFYRSFRMVRKDCIIPFQELVKRIL
jgi:hypothetical protein